MVESVYRKNIILTGPESTGKTDLSTQLAQRFKGQCIEEFARGYIERLNRKYNYDDILLIARHQRKAYHDSGIGPICFFDTHLVITKIWFQWIYNDYPGWIDHEISLTKDALYVLCVPDIPWQQDKLRENGGQNRIKLFNLYRKELEANNLNYELVDGLNKKRFLNAVKIVKEFLNEESR